MITIKNTQRKIKVNINKFKADAQIIMDALGYGDFDLGVWFTTNKTIRFYNKEYRHKDKATDVLSFPFYPELKAGERIAATSDDEKNLGDLIIAPEYMQADAHTMGITLEERLEHIIVHGICHLLGYDHYTPDKDVVMHDLETKMLTLIQK